MRAYWVTLISTLLAVASINLYIDPAHRWHTGPYHFNQLWGKNECRIVPLQMDETLLTEKMIDLIDKPEVVLFASSRGLQVSSSMFSPNVNFFNASLSGANLWNYDTLWEFLEKAHKIPEKLILFLDSSQFRESTSILHSSTEFHRKARAIKNYFRSLQPQELLNWALLKNSVSQMIHPPSSPEPIGQIIPEPDYSLKGMNCERGDGSLIYHDGFGEKLDIKNVKESTAPTFGKGNWVYEDFIGRHISSVDAFTQFIQKVRAHGTKVFIIVPPIQNEVYRYLMSRNEARESFTDIQKFTQMIAARTDTPVCDRIDPNSIQCHDDEFMDSWHMQPTCGEKLIQSCLTAFASPERQR